MTTFLKQVLTPIVGRAGTLVTGLLVGSGVPENHTQQLVVALGVALSLAFDAAIVVIAKRKTTR